MKRVRSNYHTLQVLKTLELKLRLAIISICNKELVNFKSDSFLNVLNGNIILNLYNTRKLQRLKAALRKVVDIHVSFSGQERHIVLRGVFL